MNIFKGFSHGSSLFPSQIPYEDTAEGQIEELKEDGKLDENFDLKEVTQEANDPDKRKYDVIAAAKPRSPRYGLTDKSNTVRYPSHADITSDTDYVNIDFFNYLPPFGKGEAGVKADGSGGKYKEVAGDEGMGQLYSNYHHSIGDNMLENYAPGYKSIMLYMPEDVNAQYGANWGGKGVGVGQANVASMIGGTAGMDIGKMWNGTFETFTGGLKIGGYSISKTLMNRAMGGSLTTDQLMGGVSGTIVNPNVELMYDAPELRGFNLNFKMMPRSSTEAKHIFTICQTLKRAMLPSWGGQTKGGFGMSANERTGNLLTIPKIVSVKFMTGNKLNPFVSQFKPCAITNVNINYTPDGSYATYSDGSPVATLLQVQFKELKLVFEQEVPLSDVPVASY